ncbi:MAG: dihydrodipicolinate synthase family protein [Planctomycetota bacterium]|jgi:4-hydroxy-tetrahydrodipicolinate synthase
MSLRPGIVSVLQTPFDAGGALDLPSYARLIEDAVTAGADGLLAPAVASEAAYLRDGERERLARCLAEAARVPWILGASAVDVATCRRHRALAEDLGATAYLVAVPEALYATPEAVVAFFAEVAAGSDLPLVVQDYPPHGPGLDLAIVRRLRDALPTLAGLKIETVPAGPKYTAVRAACGEDLFIAGGWAVPQMIEALDRGVDAMMPEGSMVRVYTAIDRAYRAGRRPRALRLFRTLLPVLAFANQEIVTSIAFFKRLLCHKGIFAHATLRWPGFIWDRFNARVADELIELYLGLEASVA